MSLALIDWLIVVAYILLTLTIGLLFSKRAGKNLTEFFISGRSLPWWIAGTSMVATGFAADTPLAVTGIVIKNGLAGNWIWWAFAMGGMITVFVYARLWRRSEVITDVELVELRYAGKPAAALRGIRAIYVALLINAIIIGWVCGAMIEFFEYTIFADMEESPWRKWALLVGCLIFVGLYSTLSGMWGVALTDAVQFVLAMLGCIVLAVIAVNHIGGVGALQEKVVEQFGSDEAMRFLPSISGEDAWMPFYAFLIMVLIQWWATWYPGSEPGGGGYVVQRMASCKDERHSLLATLWYQIAYYCLRPWPWVMVGFVALVLYPQLREGYLAGSKIKPEVGYPMVIRDLAPVGLRGLMLVTFFAAFMSTISTQMNWGASYLVRDFYQRFIKTDGSDKHYARASRIASVIVLCCGGVAAWLLYDQSIDDIWNILMALGAGTGIVFMLRWFWWRINAWSEIVAMISSLLFFLLIGVDKKNLFTELLIVETQQLKILLVATGSIVAWVAATFLTSPEPMKKLVSFYSKVRPGGPGWKPVAEKAGKVDVDDNLVVSIIAAFFAAGLVYSTIPMIGFAIFRDYQSAGICFGIAMLCGVVVIYLVRRIGWKKVV